MAWPPWLDSQVSRLRRGVTFAVPGPLPGLNKLLDWRSSGFWRGGRRVGDRYWSEKKRWAAAVQEALLVSGSWDGRPLEGRVACWFRWREKARRRDPDNFTAGGRKIILDALVSAGVLPNDGWNLVEFHDLWLVDRDDPGVDVVVAEVRADGEEA